MLRVKQHFQLCAEAIPPLPPLLSLPWQLEQLLPSAQRQHLGNGGMDRVAEQLAASTNNLERRRYYLCHSTVLQAVT